MDKSGRLKTIRHSISAFCIYTISFLTLAILTGNSRLAAASTAYVSAEYSGFVNSISDPTGMLGSTIEEGDVVTSDFRITTHLIECGGPFAAGTICYYYDSSTLAASLTLGTTDFDNVDLRLREVWSGFFAGEAYSQLVMDGPASAPVLGAVGLGLQVRDADNFWPAEWPSAEDFHLTLSENLILDASPLAVWKGTLMRHTERHY